MRPSSAWIITTMSSTVSTVRSAVLNGVFSGTRSMASRMSVIFMGGGVPSGPDAPDAGDAVDRGRGRVRHHRQDGGHDHAVEVQADEVVGALGLPGHAAGVVDGEDLAGLVPDHHHHVAGDVDEVADARLAKPADALAVAVAGVEGEPVQRRA